MPNIFLVGFMGSGKSTVASELAAAMGLSVLDLDTVVIERENMTIPELFDELGETGFRRVETAALEAVIGDASNGGYVVALGGGAFCSEVNRRLIDQVEGISVYLDLPWSVIESRIPEYDPERPVFLSYSDVKILFENRRSDYERAELILKLEGHESPVDIASMIESSLVEASCAI